MKTMKLSILLLCLSLLCGCGYNCHTQPTYRVGDLVERNTKHDPLGIIIRVAWNDYDWECTVAFPNECVAVFGQNGASSKYATVGHIEWSDFDKFRDSKLSKLAEKPTVAPSSTD